MHINFDSKDLMLMGDCESAMQVVPGHRCLLQKEAVDAFLALKADALSAGFDLRVASGFRSFARQLIIWNAKASGQRPVLDDQGNKITIKKIGEWKAVESILRFSALPGTSRHHWGTDMDIFDASTISANYQVELTVAETETKGPFFQLHRWLDEKIAQNRSYGFFRPYARDLGGVSPEPWHLSYAPLAQTYEHSLTSAMVYHRLVREDIGYKNLLLTVLPQIMQRFVWATAMPPWEV